MLTASSVFLQVLCDAGITHAFVNWGSDHPALLADLERQRSASAPGHGTKPTIITCPNEMVALSAAQGYAQVTGKPALVIVHVDVGTQALAGAVHNVDRCRAPVIIYAGASPFSTEGEHKGTRNEWIMWLQDIPDQSAIVRQYMRYSSQLHSALTIPGVIRRAVQIASSTPKGPVYLWARREVMEQEIDPTLFKDIVTSNAAQIWPAVEPSALTFTAASRIGSALLTAQHPLILTSYIGHNPHAITPLLALSLLLSIPILPVCPSTVCVPFSHPFGLAPTYLHPTPGSTSGNGHSDEPATPGSPHAAEDLDHLALADVILVIDSDLSWIPANNQRPRPGARIFVVDSGDPLKTTVQMGWWRGEAEMICRADAEAALGQILHAARAADHNGMITEGEDVKRRARRMKRAWQRRVTDMEALELDFSRSFTSLPEESIVRSGERISPAPLPSSPRKITTFTVPNIIRALREGVRDLTPSRGERLLVLNETVTNFSFVWEHMRPEAPGSLLTSGGSSLGWSLGAAVGASLADSVPVSEEGSVLSSEGDEGHDLIVVIVGDGSYMFGVPSSAYWMARRYETPFLTIILNNGGWKAPKFSMLAVHPYGHNGESLASVPADDLSVGFGPVCPDYAHIAVAATAGWAWGARVGGWDEPETISAGANGVGTNGKSANGVHEGHADGGKAMLEETIRKGIEVVLKERRCAVIDCFLDRG